MENLFGMTIYESILGKQTKMFEPDPSDVGRCWDCVEAPDGYCEAHADEHDDQHHPLE